MNTREVFMWMHMNLAPHINKAIEEKKKNNPQLLYTAEWLIGITYRETGQLINKYACVNTRPDVIHTLMRGDFSQRPGEKEKQYHGFGYVQIDIASYPDFVKSGAWKDPLKCYLKAIDVLEEKRKYIEGHMIRLCGDDLHRAITAAYNCGQGNVVKALAANKDVDNYTTGRDYSKDVWQRRSFYRQILTELNN